MDKNTNTTEKQHIPWYRGMKSIITMKGFDVSGESPAESEADSREYLWAHVGFFQYTYLIGCLLGLAVILPTQYNISQTPSQTKGAVNDTLETLPNSFVIPDSLQGKIELSE